MSLHTELKLHLDWENPIADIILAPDVEPEWLIKDVFLKETFICMGGEPAAGKSLISYIFAVAFATGCHAFTGIKPAGEPLRVLYFDQENSPPNRNKYIKWAWNGLKDSHGEEPDLGLLTDNFFPVSHRLGGADWFDQMCQFVDLIQPQVVFIDTASSAFPVANENDNAEAAQIIHKLRHVMTRTNPQFTLIVLKHAKMQTDDAGKRRMRGATQWQGLADQVVFQVKGTGRPPTKKGKGLFTTKLVPDKTRAFGLRETIKFTPSWSDEAKTGMIFEARFEEKKEANE